MPIDNVYVIPKIMPILDPAFRPAILENRAFTRDVELNGECIPIKIAIERENNQIYVLEAKVFSEESELEENNNRFIERLIKTILWIKGGFKITIGGSKKIGDFVKKTYSIGGLRAFDALFMSRVYEKDFEVCSVDIDEVPEESEIVPLLSRNLDGCRIGFDAGGSDRKVVALKNGEVVYSEEVAWHPKTQSDPDYHYREIEAAIKTAAAHLPRVDAIGVSSAGIYVNNRAMIASLFLKVPQDLFDQKIKDIYLNIQREWENVPLLVRNDGDVTALAGAMSLNDTNILGIAMGTSEAAGYIDDQGNIKGWLNELAFVPVDLNPNAMVDEWSLDHGCGVKYFSQDAVIKLAPAAEIQLEDNLSPAEKLRVVQKLMEEGHEGARNIYETIGVYLGYTIPYYAEFYHIKHLLILGRVTSGEGGNIILNMAKKVLDLEFPELSSIINLHIPDESDRRIGQAVAAASLPMIE